MKLIAIFQKKLLLIFFIASITFSCSDNETSSGPDTTEEESSEVDMTGGDGMEGGLEGDIDEVIDTPDGNETGGESGSEGNGGTEGGNETGGESGSEGNGGTEEGGEETPTNGDIYLTDNLIIDKSGEFVTYVLPESDYRGYIFRENSVSGISKEVLKYLNDDFDMIVVLGSETNHPEGVPAGVNTPVRNQVEGIGSSLFNSGSAFGSQGELNCIIYMPRISSINNGPFLHEIAHMWANRGFITTNTGGHWGYSSAGGQLGGFDTIEDLGSNTYQGTTAGRGFGTFANGGNRIPYSNVELYLMGLIPENELEPIQMAINPVPGSAFGQFTADEIKTFTPAELIEMHGKRVPSYENSQREYKILTVILSSETELEESEKEDAITRLQDFFKQGEPSRGSNNFWTATREKAIIVNKIDASSIK